MSNWANRNIKKVCSYCGYDKATVDREAYYGMCTDCTDRSLHSNHMMNTAKKNNKKINNGYMPWPCTCDSTIRIAMCDDETCDGIFFWAKF
jgi:hypothetical protein